MSNQASNRPPDALDIGLVHLRGRPVIGLPIGTASGSSVWSGIDVVDESRVGPDRCADAQGVVLALDESLKVVVDDGLNKGRQMSVTPRAEEDRMPTEALGHTGDAGLGAVEGAGDLSVARAGGEPRGDCDKQLGALEVIGGGEGLAGAGAFAVETAEAWDAARRSLRPVRTEALESVAAGPMGFAFGPGAEGRKEPGRAHALEGLLWPAHTAA